MGLYHMNCSVIWYFMVTFWMTWMNNEFIYWPKPYVLWLATCDEIFVMGD